MTKKQQLVMFEWNDSAMHGTDQISRKDAKKELGLIEGVSAGLLVHEDKNQITIALDWFHKHDDFRQVASYSKKDIKHLTRKELRLK